MPMFPSVLNTIPIATYNDGSTFPLVKLNYVFGLDVSDDLIEVLSRNSSAIPPYDGYSTNLDLNMWLLYLLGPYGFCTWKQLAWHSGNSIVFGLGRNSEFWQVNEKGETVVDWSLSPVGDIELPAYGHIKLFDEKSVEPIHIGNLVTQFSFGNELWKIPDPEIMDAIGDKESIPASFSGVKSIIAVPSTGAKTLNAKVLSSILEFQGNPEQVIRTKEELRRLSYGKGMIGSLWVGEKIFPSRFNSLKGHTRERDMLMDSSTKPWSGAEDSFDGRAVFWRARLADQLLALYVSKVYNSQDQLMDFSSYVIGDSYNRWPLVSRVDTSVYDRTRHTLSLAKTGELATNPVYNSDPADKQGETNVGHASQIFTVLGDNPEWMTESIDKLNGMYNEMELRYHAPLQAQKEPWYPSYDEFQNVTRPLSKGFAVLPEFKISDVVASGVDITDDSTIALVGDTASTSNFAFDDLTDAFSEDYVLSSELMTIKNFSSEVSDKAKKRTVKFDFEAVKKLHPYVGFFPADRALQIGNLLYTSYYNCIYGVKDISTTPSVSAPNKKNWQMFLYHMMAPGLFYNSIKSAMGVGLPVFSGGSSVEFIPIYGYGRTGTGPYKYYNKCIMSNPRFYLPFETLFNIPKHILNVQGADLSTILANRGKLMFAPHIWKSCPVGKNEEDLNCFFVKDKFQPLFDLANHNFFAESAELFLKNGLTAFYSKPESQFKDMVGGSVYYMDVVLRNKNCVVCEGYSDQFDNDNANYVLDKKSPIGLDNASFSGTFSDDYYSACVRISILGGAGADSFQYSLNGGAWSGNVVITGAAQALGDSGVVVKFESAPGHTLNDFWTWSRGSDLNLSQRGSIFGYPMSLDSSLAYLATNGSAYGVGGITQREYDVRDPAYGPFTPPYFYAPAVARISFDPQEADPDLQTGQTKKFSLDEILKHAEIRMLNHTNTGGQVAVGTEYFAYPGADDEINALNGLFHEYDWKTGLADHADDVYSSGSAVSTVLASTILQSGFMNITESVDLFGKKLVTSASFDGRQNFSRFRGVNKSLGAEKEYAWCISTKWESPVLNFNKHSTSTYDNVGSSVQTWPGRARGMWMDYGQEPDAEDGLFLEIRESFPERKAQSRQPSVFIGSVTDTELKGTRINMNDVMLNDIADSFDLVDDNYIAKKKVESLIDVCGFSVGESKLGVVKDENTISEAVVILPYHRVNGEVKFFEIDKNVLEEQLQNQQKFGYAHKDVYGKERKTTSITDLVEKASRFVLPPWLDFVKNDVTPVVMYICDFDITLEKSDLLDVWQNLSPSKFYDVETEKKTIQHGWDSYELFHGQELPEDTRFAVFKVKQRAAWNYYAVKPSHSADEEFVFEILNDKGAWESKPVDYNFNWPYDFCSLVEFGKVSCSFEFVGE